MMLNTIKNGVGFFNERSIATLRFTNQEVFTKIGFVISRLRQHIANNKVNLP